MMAGEKQVLSQRHYNEYRSAGKKESSSDYMYRCAAIIESDRSISHDTIIVMFVEYEKKLRAEIADEIRVK